MDPQTATCVGFNKTTAYDESSKTGQTAWLHLSELGGPQWLNDMKMAEVLVASGDLASRPSQYQALADEGYKQYEFHGIGSIRYKV